MIFVYLFTLLILALYSYSQIDLNLTIFQNPFFLSFQNMMIQLGYFQRPVSTAIFLVLITILFSLYLTILRKNPDLKILVGGVIAISLIAYPFLSHDFFNYLFDARILVHYHQNPYFFKALDFPNDLWLRFMHWTHRTYPYGPVWLAVTAIPSFLGFGKFVLTAINFKILFTLFYLGNVILLKKLRADVLFFAASPFVLIESLFSPHIDSAMTFFMLLAVYFSVSHQKLFSALSLLLSAGTKFLTVVLAPLIFKPNIKLGFLLMVIVLIPIIIQREFYPWYFLPAFSIAAILKNRPIRVLTTGLSIGLVLRYLPLLYFGQEVLLIENILTIVPVLLCALGLIFYQQR